MAGKRTPSSARSKAMNHPAGGHANTIGRQTERPSDLWTHSAETTMPRPVSPFRPGLESLEDRCLPATYFVAPGGNDAGPGSAAQPLGTIQAGLNRAVAGDTVTVAGGTYAEKLTFPHSGAAGSFITLQGAPGARPLVTSGGSPGGNLMLLQDVSFVRVTGFEIAGLQTSDGSGIRLLGSGTDLEVRNNVIHDILGTDAMAVTVYGSSSAAPL